MLDFIIKYIREFISERIYRIHESILPRDKEYLELGKKPAEIMRQLIAGLTPEKQEMLNEYDEAQTLQMNRQDEIIYSRGLVDGILLGYLVDQTRREPERFLSRLGL